MGEAKKKRERLGEWYGKPVVPGHPDYVAPPPAEPRQEYAQAPRVPRGVRSMFAIMALAGGLAVPTSRGR